MTGKPELKILGSLVPNVFKGLVTAGLKTPDSTDWTLGDPGYKSIRLPQDAALIPRRSWVGVLGWFRDVQLKPQTLKAFLLFSALSEALYFVIHTLL